ncbi:MAG TPA: type II secretion system protein GspE, partial [Parvularcula sp.]|nr:type II secretion system protein GspE [Parvularcula sp.]HBS33988.1 type II secretion system protein GspE [Parvularcula sp.]
MSQTVPVLKLAYAFAKENGLVVLDAGARPARIGARGTPDPRALLEVRRIVNAPIAIDEMPGDAFERRLSEIYSADGIRAGDFEMDRDADDLAALAEGLPATADLLDTEDDAPVIRLINAIIAEAVKLKASDIHVEPYEKTLFVRLRIDGVLREILSLPSRMTPVLTSRVKV